MGRKSRKNINMTVTEAPIEVPVSLLRVDTKAAAAYARLSSEKDTDDHKAKVNRQNLPQYYAKDQHDAIIERDDFALVQKMIAANKGSRNAGLPHMEIYESGYLKGFVSAVPSWKGFDAEDYNRAGLRASGTVSEADLEAYEGEIIKALEEADKVENTDPNFEYQYEIDSDNYELFPEETSELPEEEEIILPSFGRLLHEKQQEELNEAREKTADGEFDLSSFELVRSQFFSHRDKVTFTMDHRHFLFNKRCYAFLQEKDIEIAYNPMENILIVRKGRGNSSRDLKWVHVTEDVIRMKSCDCSGLAQALYDNNGWNPDYRYRILGCPYEFEDEKALVFYLDEPIILVSTKLKATEVDTRASIGNDAEMQNLSDAQRIADQFKEETGTVEEMKHLSRSVAIYYSEILSKHKDNITLEDLGLRRYDAACIRQMLISGLQPEEGWEYLDGMAHMSKSSFSLYPSEWADEFGENYYSSSARRFEKKLKKNRRSEESATTYGWTVGLDVPTMETVREAIAHLQEAKA